MAVPNPYAALLDAIPVDRREVEVDGSTTAYWVYGPADAETTIVAVHGFRGEHHGLEPVVAHLPDVRVISPDLPGFAETPPLAGRRHDIQGYAAWLRGNGVRWVAVHVSFRGECPPALRRKPSLEPSAAS